MTEVSSQEPSVRRLEAKVQTITIVNPNDSTRQAVLNIWFIGKDIVIGGVGWYEYYDYEELLKKGEIKQKGL